MEQVVSARRASSRLSLRVSAANFMGSFRRSLERSEQPKLAEGEAVSGASEEESAAPSSTPEFCALRDMPEMPEGIALDNRHPMRLTYGAERL